MNNWLYKDKRIESIEDFPIDTFGFIYCTIYLPTGQSYIGKKELLTQPVTRGRTKLTKKITKESDWKTYYGSAIPILELIKQGKQSDFERKILCLATSKKLLTYFECKYLFKYEVLEQGNLWFNNNIQGHFFKKDFEYED